MANMAEVLARFRSNPPLSESEAGGPFKLSSTLCLPATRTEIEQAWPRGVPAALVETWMTTGRARLFEDIEYGQWGLIILSPPESAERTEIERSARPADYAVDDIVIGEFLGDQELLVLTGDGHVLVALPLDDRNDWYVAAEDLAGFLEDFWKHKGDKYWE